MSKWRNMCRVRRLYDNLSMLLWIHWKYLPGKWVRNSFSSFSRGMNLLLLTPLKPNYRFQWQWYFYEYKTLVFTVYIIMYTNQIIDLKGQLNSRALQGTQARPPSHVKLYRALRDSKRVRYGYLMISKDIWRLPSLCNDNTFVRRNTVELERGFKTVTYFLLTCVRKVWSVPIYLWIRIIKGKTEFLLLWNSFCKHQSTEQLFRLLWILLKFLRSEDDYVPSHIRLFCSSS